MIINCTQHRATSEQLAAGVVDFPEPERSELIKLLTFEELPRIDRIHERSRKICELVDSTFKDATPKVLLLGGAPFLMGTLERHIIFRGGNLYTRSLDAKALRNCKQMDLSRKPVCSNMLDL